MEEITETIGAAGNVEVPAYLALQALDCVITREFKENGDEQWLATRGHCRYMAEGPIELLGIVAMHLKRGNNWKAEDAEIEQFVRTFYPEAS
jgi:hypothetical protein